MAQTAYAGLDYSLGRSNVNKETGIHYGVIAMNSINLDYTSDFEYDYGKPYCPDCGKEIRFSSASDLFADYPDLNEADDSPEWFDGKDYCCVDCQQCYWSDQCFGDEAIGWSFEEDGYKLTDCLDTNIFVLESPFYTRAQFCSPCVPGAGNLDSPCDDGPKTSCLGHEWFDGDKAPYRVFRVSDDTEVLSS